MPTAAIAPPPLEFTPMNSVNLEFGAAASENIIFAAGAKGIPAPLSLTVE